MRKVKMTDWKTLTEILPEMGRAAEADPANWFEDFEFKSYENSSGTLRRGTSLALNFSYRRKPRTMTYTVERPEPMLVPPEIGQDYWIADAGHPHWATKATWRNNDMHKRHFIRGLCYATEEEAVAAAKAMAGGE
jgi:hypothetical protein